MSDHRFTDRLKRIETRQRSGAPVQILAGVGDVKEAEEAAEGKPRASLILALLGASAGVWSLQVLKNQVGLNGLLSYPPEMLLEIALAEPMIGAAAGLLVTSALLAVISFLKGRKAFKIMSFSWAALGGAIGGLVAASG